MALCIIMIYRIILRKRCDNEKGVIAYYHLNLQLLSVLQRSVASYVDTLIYLFCFHSQQAAVF